MRVPLLDVGLVIQRRYPALLWEVNFFSLSKQCRGLQKRDFWSQVGFRGVEAPTNLPHPQNIGQLVEIQADVPFYSQVNKLKRRGELGKTLFCSDKFHLHS